MRILVTGGAGYIGSFMVKRLLEEGHNVVVVDDFKRGHKGAVDNRAKIIEGNLLDKEFVKDLFNENKFDGAIHFAGYISVEESVENPGMYFENNIFAAVNILEEMKRSGVNNIVFSSTAAVYGNPLKTPIAEDHPKNPTAPYGESKLAVEKILSWYQKAYNINSTSLRYFNASGGALDGSMGENHVPETHIIPNAIRAALNDSEFTLYGKDYNTVDGTCIRDYIHVLDLIDAHLLSLKKMEEFPGYYIYNVGIGKGYTNKEVIEMVQKISGKNLKVKISQRRPGDPEVLIADPSLIKQELNFVPKYSDLETIVKTAWEWHKNNSKFPAKQDLAPQDKI